MAGKVMRIDVAYVEVTGGAQPLVQHLSTTAPHRLLRLEVIGTPLELVRTGPSGS